MKLSFTINHNENQLPYVPPFKATMVELGVNVTGFTTYVLETEEYTEEAFRNDLAECWMMGTYLGSYRAAIMNLRIMHTVINASPSHMYTDTWPNTKGPESMLRALLNMVNSLIHKAEYYKADDETKNQLENLSKQIEDSLPI